MSTAGFPDSTVRESRARRNARPSAMRASRLPRAVRDERKHLMSKRLKGEKKA